MCSIKTNISEGFWQVWNINLMYNEKFTNNKYFHKSGDVDAIVGKPMKAITYEKKV